MPVSRIIYSRLFTVTCPDETGLFASLIAQDKLKLMSTHGNKFLLIYYNGSRGDFLSSVLFGDILANSYHDHRIDNVGKGSGMIVYKWHQVDQLMYGYEPGQKNNAIPPRPLTYFDAIIRIKLEGIDDYETVNLLSRHKLNDRNWRPTLRTAETYEKTFSIFDRAYNKVIPFKELWNINDIKYLFEDLRSRAMTQDEQRRIEHNININLELLHTLRNNA